MYSKTHWQDRVVDPETGEVVQEGTFMSAEHFNNMEDGIEANDAAISEISESVETIETTLDKDVGTTIALTVNSSTFVMKLALKNSEGDILSESEVDLPIESMIVNAEYVEATKSLVLTLQSGSKVTVPLSALINGLVNDTRKVAGMDLKKDITVAEMVTALGVDKKVNKTSVSSSENSTTSVINVTDAKAQMAMVAKISGKTVKDGTTLKSAAVESVVSQGKNIADFVDIAYETNGIKCSLCNNRLAASGTAAATNTTDISLTLKTPIVVKNGDKISVTLKGASTSAAYLTFFMYDEGTKVYPLSAQLAVSSGFKNTITSTGNYKIVSILLRIPPNYTISATNAEFMIEKSATPTEFSSCNKTTVLVPSEARNCAGYGLGISDSLCNIVDFENGVYTQMLNEVDFGSLSSWSYNTNTKEFSIAKPSDCPAGVWTEVPSILAGKYTTYSNQYFDVNTATLNNAICLTASALKIKDNAYTNADALKTALTGQKLIYKLASTVTKPLTDFIRPLPVENGGTLTLVNEHNLDVNSVIKYKKEV